MASLSICLKIGLFILIIFHIILFHNSLLTISTLPEKNIIDEKYRTSGFSNKNNIPSQHMPSNTLQVAPVTPPANGKNRSSPVHSVFPNDHNFADTRHMGDLFTVRDKDVHSLSWTVDLREDCDINQVIGAFRSKSKDSIVKFLDDQNQKLGTCNKLPFELLLLKKVLPFGNTYLIAHTYFKFYRRLFQNSRRKFMRSIANNQHTEKISSFNKLEKPIDNTNIFEGISPTSVFFEKNPSNIDSLLPLEASLNSPTQESNLSLTASNKTQSTEKRPTSSYTSSAESRSSKEHSHRQLPHSRILLAQTVERCVSSYLQQHPCVLRHAQEVLHKRIHRDVVQSDLTSSNTENEHPRVRRAKPHFTDPLYKEQWHLHGSNTSTSTMSHHINVAGAWESGVTGEGVTVCVIDDGLEWNHTDIRDNYNKLASYDLNADDPDPSPARNGEANEHGTRCAGEIAGVANTVCGVGVAYRASVSGVRVLGGRMTDSMEALAFSYQIHHNDVYSCSWGPEDDGCTVEGPHALGRRALRWGTSYGRKGRGAVYVVASGNGGSVQDNCNFDGYANSIYTVTIGAVDSDGKLPYYGERCAAMLAVAPSSGHLGKDIVTTDWHESSPSGCTLHHTGTSAAAPLAAGVVALALQTQPCLGWRDVQYLMVITSRKIDEDSPEWFTNAAGLSHSHTHGFGLLDATGMVSAAAVWESLPFATKFVGPRVDPNNGGALGNGSSVFEFAVTQEQLDRFGLRTLETVEVRVWLAHEYRGSLSFVLVCPSGTNTTLATSRPLDKSSAGLSGWPLVSVRCWAEAPAGTYRLILTRDPNMASQVLRGSLEHWQLVLHGSSAPLEEIARRIRQARAAVQGISVHISNRSSLCHATPPQYPQVVPIPPNWLKILLLVGCIAAVSAVVSSLEYAFCYSSEKRKFQEAIEQMQRARQTFGGGGVGTARGKDHVALYSRPGLADPRRTRGSSVSYAPARPREATLQHVVPMEGGSAESHRPLLCTDGTSSCDDATAPLLTSRRVPMLPSSPSLSCDADQSASPDDNDYTDDDGRGGDATSTTQPRDTTDHALTTTDHYFTTTTDADDDEHTTDRGVLVGGKGGGKTREPRVGSSDAMVMVWEGVRKSCGGSTAAVGHYREACDSCCIEAGDCNRDCVTSGIGASSGIGPGNFNSAGITSGNSASNSHNACDSNSHNACASNSHNACDSRYGDCNSSVAMSNGLHSYLIADNKSNGGAVPVLCTDASRFCYWETSSQGGIVADGEAQGRSDPTTALNLAT